MFHTIWVHSGPFGCLTKLGAKRVELVQKFVPRSRIGIFRNERTRSALLDPKLMFGAFCTIWVHSVLFGCLTKLGAKRAEVVQKFVPQSRVRIFCNKRTRSTPLDPKLTFWSISYYSGAFMAAWLLTKLGAKRAELVQKFVLGSRIGIFRNERTRTTPLDPKLNFWCISYYFGAIGTVWLPYETRCTTGRTGAKVRAMKSRWNFSQRTHPNHPIRPETNVLVCFVLFCCIRDRLLALRNSVQNGPN